MTLPNWFMLMVLLGLLNKLCHLIEFGSMCSICRYMFGLSPHNVGLLIILDKNPQTRQRRLLTRTITKARAWGVKSTWSLFSHLDSKPTMFPVILLFGRFSFSFSWRIYCYCYGLFCDGLVYSLVSLNPSVWVYFSASEIGYKVAWVVTYACIVCHSWGTFLDRPLCTILLPCIWFRGEMRNAYFFTSCRHTLWTIGFLLFDVAEVIAAVVNP